MRVRIRFSGKVQGVGFRATARGIARRHGLVGWVRNEPDGTVLLEAQGPRGEIDAVVAEIRAAFPVHLRAVDEQPMGELPGESGFEIER